MQLLPSSVLRGDHLTSSCLALFLQRPSDRVSVFMGVPTMYSYLLSRYDDMAPAQQQAAADAARQVRERGSGRGLAACPLIATIRMP